MAAREPKIKVTKNGPYIVTGGVPLEREIVVRDRNGIPVEWKKAGTYQHKDTYSLCRCGRSESAPFCDGTHVVVGFKGDERADRRPYAEQCNLVKGETLDMTDAKDLCMGAQFCHRGGGVRNLVLRSDDPSKRALAIEAAGQCPSGRLVACEKDGTPIEPFFEKSISVTEDPGRGTDGPLWVKGGIPIVSSDGFEYEVRNRVTLCRCGHSECMPLCDGTHNEIRFKSLNLSPENEPK